MRDSIRTPLAVKFCSAASKFAVRIANKKNPETALVVEAVSVVVGWVGALAAEGDSSVRSIINTADPRSIQIERSSPW